MKRNSNIEYRNPKQIPITKIQMFKTLEFKTLNIVSNLVLRASDFINIQNMSKIYKQQFRGILKKVYKLLYWILLFNMIALGWPGHALAASGDGMLVYDEDGANSPSPHYRTWNGTDLSAESNMQADETVTDEVNHTIIEASPTRDEYIRGSLTIAGHLDVQVYSGGSWIDGGNAPTNGDFTTSIGTLNDFYRAFDISYEESTGDGMVVYESTSTADKTIMYRTWDGTNWSAEQTLDYSAVAEGGATDVTVWVELEGDYGSNNILLGWETQNGWGFYGARWDGTQWLDIALVSGAGVTSSKLQFDVAWEGTSGKGKMVYATGKTIGASTYTPGSGWTADTVTSPINIDIRWVRISGSPNNNYIAVMANGDVSTRTADMYVDMWNGTDWTTVGTITRDADINNNGYAQPMDVAWEKAASADRALFVWRDGTTDELSLRYMVYDISVGAYLAIDDDNICNLTGTNVDQTVTSMALAENSNGPCTGLGDWPTEVSGVDLTADPGSRKIMVLAENLTADLKPEAQLWNGTDAGTWLTQTANMGAIELDLSTGASLDAALPTKPYDFAFNTFESIPTLGEILFLALIGCMVFLGIKSGAIKIKREANVDAKNIKEPPIKQLPIENMRRNNHQSPNSPMIRGVRSVDGITKREMRDKK